ncbi:hypothetical protein MARPO_0158s0039 [Marchantia polymorpha]|uniref:Partial AB-hydrolase lipase domain-containing protein n=1 Tax=Marchantia polymorpha TaxID=3197 RepID=A0A2R6W4D8_MARPO|nr:hypothetical protein MARPO_0158s0039 [Marchantia polymorpha]|eukprot:PTQ28662.1 hypothetical protein MARPO_0158s0039 [Marchantia polymorpha]
MGSSNRPLSSWLSLVTLIATLAVVSQCVEMLEVDAHASLTFCEIHVLPRGYDCEEHEVYSEDGYMLRLHRVIPRASLEKSVWEWLEPELRHKHKHKGPFPGFKKPRPAPEAVPSYTSPSSSSESPPSPSPPPSSFSPPGEGTHGGPSPPSSSYSPPGGYGGPSPSSSSSPPSEGAYGGPSPPSSSYSPPGGYGGPSPSSSSSPPSEGAYGGQSPPSSSYSPPGGYGGPSPSSSSSPPSEGAYGGPSPPSSSYSPPGGYGGPSPSSSSSPPSEGAYGGPSPPSSSYSPPGGYGGPTPSAFSPPGASTYGGSNSAPSSYSPPAAAGYGAPSPAGSRNSPPSAAIGGVSPPPTSFNPPPASGGYGAPSPPDTESHGGVSTPPPSYSPPTPSESNSPPGAGNYGEGSSGPSTSAISPPPAGSGYGGSPPSSTSSPPNGSGGSTSSSSAECTPGLSSPNIARRGLTSSNGREQPRTPTRNAELVDGEPVLLMHHELLNGGSWFTPVASENDTVLPLKLVDQGFDVWIGHERATLWSHEHRKLTPNDAAYWNWTWDQHVEHDVPKLLAYISDETGSRVHYVGVSLSAAVGAAAATNAGVASLMKTLTLIAPAFYRGKTTSEFLQAWDPILLRSALGTSDDEWHDNRLGAFNITRPRLLPGSECALARQRMGWSDVVQESRAPPSGNLDEYLSALRLRVRSLQCAGIRGQNRPSDLRAKRYSQRPSDVGGLRRAGFILASRRCAGIHELDTDYAPVSVPASLRTFRPIYEPAPSGRCVWADHSLSSRPIRT